MRGYVVRWHRDYPAQNGKPAWSNTSWWLGPDHMFGTTSGPLHFSSVATFPNRLAAERALRSVFGTLAQAKRQGYSIVADPRPVKAVSS